MCTLLPHVYFHLRQPYRKEYTYATSVHSARHQRVITTVCRSDGVLGAELEAAREENARLRQENANMFAISDENASLRTEVETLRLQLECLVGGEVT